MKIFLGNEEVGKGGRGERGGSESVKILIERRLREKRTGNEESKISDTNNK